ncbi:MAG TPA: PAC2 family protein [Thermoleophilaceae bacterium]|nr:PAC2 family protein [Thermoleophilaceae bacterium]
MDPIRWTSRPELRDPVLVCAFNGWNDAGEAASAALGLIHSDFGGNEVAEIDPEEFFDFTAVRPTIRLIEGRTRVIEWPSNTFHAAHVPAAERDLLLLRGTEPSLRWRSFNDAIIRVADEVDVKLVVTLGALLADVPHTRPVAVTGFSSDEALIADLGLQRSSYEGPTGVVGALHHACQQHGLPSASLWASVPHYVAAAPNPQAALALIRGFEGLVGVAVDAAPLEEAAAEYDRQVNEAVASDPDVKAFVEQLEQRMDDVQADSLPDRLPSADSIARDFQRYLKQRGPES